MLTRGVSPRENVLLKPSLNARRSWDLVIHLHVEDSNCRYASKPCVYSFCFLLLYLPFDYRSYHKSTVSLILTNALLPLLPLGHRSYRLDTIGNLLITCIALATVATEMLPEY
jgi:hypothetical protein